MADFGQLAVECLSFDPVRRANAHDVWVKLDRRQRRQLLESADRSGLTLHLLRTARCGGIAVADFAEYDTRLEKNTVRLKKRESETAGLLALFQRAGLHCAVLKGFTVSPEFVPSARDRIQYDIDFYFSHQQAQDAFHLLREQGYEPIARENRGPLDHLPPLAKKTGWEWRGDFFDVDIPAAVEVHFQLWDREFERIDVCWEGEPLERIELRNGWPVLSLPDQLAQLSLHVMRHLFRGSLRLSHLYEIAYFLKRHSGDEAFWQRWRAAHNLNMRRLCAACFGLAERLFAVNAPEAQPEAELVPAAARAWIERHAHTLVGPARNKAELLLQLSFVEGTQNRVVVLRRRLLPLALPAPIDAVYVPGERLALRRRFLRSLRQARFNASRAVFHARSLAGFLALAARWRW